MNKFFILTLLIASPSALAMQRSASKARAQGLRFAHAAVRARRPIEAQAVLCRGMTTESDSQNNPKDHDHDALVREQKKSNILQKIDKIERQTCSARTSVMFATTMGGIPMGIACVEFSLSYLEGGTVLVSYATLAAALQVAINRAETKELAPLKEKLAKLEELD